MAAQPESDDQVKPVMVTTPITITPNTCPVTMAGNVPATLELLTRESVEAERRASHTRNATKEREAASERLHSMIRTLSQQALTSNPGMTRTDLANEIADKVGRSADRALTLLKQLNIPPKKDRSKRSESAR